MAMNQETDKPSNLTPFGFDSRFMTGDLDSQIALQQNGIEKGIRFSSLLNHSVVTCSD
jgi:hypothetical protein